MGREGGSLSASPVPLGNLHCVEKPKVARDGGAACDIFLDVAGWHGLGQAAPACGRLHGPGVRVLKGERDDIRDSLVFPFPGLSSDIPLCRCCQLFPPTTHSPDVDPQFPPARGVIRAEQEEHLPRTLRKGWRAQSHQHLLLFLHGEPRTMSHDRVPLLPWAPDF